MPPDWFQRFTSVATTNHSINIDGKKIHYRRWPRQGAQEPLRAPFEKPLRAPFEKPLRAPLLFVHGYGAHSHWWDFIAPAFTDDFDVVAMDMGGAGDSEHRDVYKATTFANEIIGVCREVRRDSQLQSPVVVGHSFGGSMTRVAAYLNGDELAGVVLVDTMLSRHRGKRIPPPKPRSRIRYYDSLDVGARRFRLRPPQPCTNDFILEHIARHSLAHGENGYYFKLDQTLFSKMEEDFDKDLPDAVTMTKESKCTVGIIYGQNSRLFPADSVEVLKKVIRTELIECVADAHHHVFLDQPLAFIDALKLLLAKFRETS